MTVSPAQPAPVQEDLFTLFPDRSPDQLERELAVRSGRVLNLTLTRNRTSMVSVARQGRDAHAPMRVRLHSAFLQAPEQVVQALAKYLRAWRRKDWALVAEYAQSIEEEPATCGPRTDLPARGSVYDLRALGKDVNRRFFQGRLKCHVGWAPARPGGRRKRRRTSIRYGSYHRDTDSIRIHPLLDDARVPRAFLEYIIYHEMLHAVVPPERRNGRWIYHPPLFRHFERRFPDWQAMQRLSRDLLDRLA